MRKVGTKRQMPSGRWKVACSRHGVRLYDTVDTEEEADQRLEEMAAQLERGREADVTLARWWELYERGKGARLARSTMRGYRHSMERFVLPSLGSVRLPELTHADVQRTLLRCPTRYTAVQARRAVSAVLGQAVAEGMLERNPVLGRLEMPEDVGCSLVIADDADAFEAISGAAAVWSAEDVMLAMPRLRGLPLESCWLCMVGAGLRREEALGLRWRDVRLRDGMVELAVHRARTELDGVKRSKTRRSVRIAVVAEPFASRLMELAGEPDELVCGVSASNLRRRWHRLWEPRPTRCPKDARVGVMLEEPAIPYLPLSRMRATHESLMQAAGVLDSVNAAAHGHSSAVAYRHYLSGDVRHASEALEELLGSRRPAPQAALPHTTTGRRETDDLWRSLVAGKGVEPLTRGFSKCRKLAGWCSHLRIYPIS